jgi:hypothetical protein
MARTAVRSSGRDGRCAPRVRSEVVEVVGSHTIYVSQPAAVAELIEKAAEEVNSAVAVR